MIVNKEILKRGLDEMGFSLWELHLYLDTHPHDAQALAEYNMLSNKLHEARAHYEQLHGPIDPTQSGNQESWQWVQGPWPWEGDANNV